MSLLRNIANNMETEITKTILLAITASTSIYLAFFKSYFTEKGKNLATRKDIGEITAIVEDVKNKFNSDAEYLKNRLNLYSQTFQSIKSLEREALIDVNKKYSEWLNTLTTFSLAFYNYENYEQLNNFYSIFLQKQKDFQVANDNLMIFVNDDEIRNILKLLGDETRELQKANMKSISSFTSNCLTYNSILKIAPQEKFESVKLEHNKREEEIFDKSLENLIVIHKRLNKHHISFILFSKVRIFQLIEE